MIEPASWIVAVDHVRLERGHRHINQVAVAGELADEPVARSVRRVVTDLDRGRRYYMVGAASGNEIVVEAFACDCGGRQIRALPEDDDDAGFDSLPAVTGYGNG